MQVQQNELVGLFKEIGHPHADDWQMRKLKRRLGKIGDGIDLDDTGLDEDEKALLVDILAAQERDEEVEIVEDEVDAPDDEEDEETEEEDQEEDEEDEETEDDSELEPEDDEEDDDLSVAEEASKAAKVAVENANKVLKAAKHKAKSVKAAKKKKAAKAKREKVKKENGGLPGIRSNKGRDYYAGLVLKNFGLKTGITDDVIAEIDARCEKNNPKMSRNAAVHAWHVLDGYLSEE